MNKLRLRMTLGSLVLVITSILATQACQAGLPPVTVGDLQAPSPISSLGDRVVWSEYDTQTKLYYLTSSSASTSNGSATRLPVAPRTIAFDVNLGSNQASQDVAVYSRCAKESVQFYQLHFRWSGADGCGIYEYDFKTDKESALTNTVHRSYSQVLPSISGNRIAYASFRDGDGGKSHQVYTSSLVGKPNRHLQSSGPSNACISDYSPGRNCRRVKNVFIWSLDLSSKGLAITRSLRSNFSEDQIQLNLHRVGHRGSKTLYKTGFGLHKMFGNWPKFDGSYLNYARDCTGECGTQGYSFVRYRLSDGKTFRALPPERAYVGGFSSSGPVVYYLTVGAPNDGTPYGPGENDCQEFENSTTCSLVQYRPQFKASP